MTREEAAKAFAAAMGFEMDIDYTPKEWGAEPDYFFVNTRGENLGTLPKPDAPLHEHLAFVGRVAEALGDPWALVEIALIEDEYEIRFLETRRGRSAGASASDPSWAAMLAATSATAQVGR